MTYKLYYALGSAAMGVRVILEEIGAPYELIQTTIAMDKPRPPEQLKLNPNGWVPVLIWGEKAMAFSPHIRTGTHPLGLSFSCSGGRGLSIAIVVWISS